MTKILLEQYSQNNHEIKYTKKDLILKLRYVPVGLNFVLYFYLFLKVTSSRKTFKRITLISKVFLDAFSTNRFKCRNNAIQYVNL